jgi:putative redox protein
MHAKRRDEIRADLFTRQIILEGPLDDEQRRKIVAIADRCPVDLTLVRGSDIESSLLDSESSE